VGSNLRDIIPLCQESDLRRKGLERVTKGKGLQSRKQYQGSLNLWEETAFQRETLGDKKKQREGLYRCFPKGGGSTKRKCRYSAKRTEERASRRGGLDFAEGRPETMGDEELETKQNRPKEMGTPSSNWGDASNIRGKRKKNLWRNRSASTNVTGLWAATALPHFAVPQGGRT